MRVVEVVFLAVVGSMVSLGLYCQVGGYLLFVAALSSVRITGENARVEMRALDADAMFRAGWVAWALPGLAAPFGLAAVIGWSVLVAAVWSSFRLRLQVVDHETTLRRCVLWILPWRVRRLRGSPHFYVAGWGDFMDPEALHLALPGESSPLQIGWSSSTSGRLAERLAEDLTARLAVHRAPSG